MRFLRRNIGFKIAAVLAAAFFWYLAHQQTQQVGGQVFDRPVEVTGIGPDGVVVTQPAQVRFRLTGPKDAMAAVNTDDVRAYVDAGGQTAGQFRRRVQFAPASLPRSLTVDLVPREVTFTLDRKIERTVPIQATASGPPPVGMEYGDLRPVVETGEVSGVSDQVADVKSLRAEVDLARLGDLAPGSYPVDGIPIRPIDADGRQVANVSVTPPTTTVVIDVRQAAATRSVFVSAQLTGQPPDPYHVTNVEVQPSQIAVTGSPDALARVTTVKTDPIDVSKLRDSIQRIIALQTTPGVGYGGRAKVRVIITVQSRVDGAAGTGTGG